MTTLCTYFWLIHWISLFSHQNLFVLVFYLFVEYHFSVISIKRDNHSYETMISTLHYMRENILWQFFEFMKLYPFPYYCMTTLCNYFWLIHLISLFDHQNLFVLNFWYICWWLKGDIHQIYQKLSTNKLWWSKSEIKWINQK